ncbi:hypothetical protein H0H87_006976 [Tephrocybe sp. NHM501043]|nr:hypothetical protein H0H87_006976 [Tephrocybe sp. NHM501043]
MDASDRGVHKSERLMNALKTAPGLFGHVNYLNLLLGLLTDPEPTMTILKSLPHLSSLSLNQTFPHGNDSRLITALIACIQQAHLRRVSINGIIDFPLHIFTAAPYLRHLSIKEFRTSDTIITNIVVPSAPAREPGYLESLSCSEGQRDSDSTRALISNLTQPASILRLTRLKRFTGGLHSKSDCQAIQKLIVLAGSSLEELSLSIRFKEDRHLVVYGAAVSGSTNRDTAIFQKRGSVQAPRECVSMLRGARYSRGLLRE